MSIKLIDAVWSLKLDNEGELLVLLALADNANDEGTHCFPSQRRIAWKTDLTVKSVSAIIARLEKKGLVETLNKGNQHRPTNYALHLERGIRKEAFIPSPWAGDKVKSTPTEVQVNSVKVEDHVGGSEMHAKESELHLHDSELHVDTRETNLNCGQQTTSTTQPSEYPSRETHDLVKPLTDAAAPAAPGASANAKAAVKNESNFPAPLPFWMTTTKRDVLGVVFIVPELRKFDGSHPRALFRIGDANAKVWGENIAKLEAAQGKLFAVYGRWTEWKGQREFVVESRIPKSIEDIAAKAAKWQPASPPVLKANVLSNPVEECIESFRKTGLALNRKELTAISAGVNNPSVFKIEAAKRLLVELPPELPRVEEPAEDFHIPFEDFNGTTKTVPEADPRARLNELVSQIHDVEDF